MDTLYLIGAVVLGALLVVTAVISLLVYKESTKLPPTGGSKYAIPVPEAAKRRLQQKGGSVSDTFTINHWKKDETDFLYTEIWGSESAYAGVNTGDRITFEPGSTIIDAGANIGMFSLYAASRCAGDATIYSFEPIPTTFSVLEANANAANSGEFNHIFGAAQNAKLKIVPINCGLSSEPSDAVFKHHPHFSVWSTGDASFAAQRLQRIKDDLPRAIKSSPNPLMRLVPSWLISLLANPIVDKLGSTVDVPVKLVTLSQIIDKHAIGRIDVLKVDVEGAEEFVLRGIKDEHWKKVQQVVMEVENFAIKDNISALLKSKGFDVTWLASERERNPGVESEVCMLYAVRPEFANRRKVTSD